VEVIYPRAEKPQTAQQPNPVAVISSQAPKLVSQVPEATALTAATEQLLQQQQQLQAGTIGAPSLRVPERPLNRSTCK